MNEDLHNIDKLFKDAFDKHDESPSADVWQNIDKDLDKKKAAFIYRKYKKLKWVAAALFIFSASMAMYTWNTRMVNQQLVEKNKNKSAEKNTPAKASDEYMNAGKKNAEKLELKKEIAGRQMKRNENIVETSTRKLPEISSKNKNDYFRKSTEKGSNHGAMVSELALKENASKKNIQPKKERQSANNSVSVNNDILYKSRLLAGKNIKPLSNANQLSNLSYLIADLQTISRDHQNFSAKDLSEISIEKVIKTITAQPLVNTLTTENSKIAKSTVKPLKEKAWAFTIFASPDFTSRRVDNDRPPFMENERSEIKQAEKYNVSSTVGLLVNYNFYKKWSIESGISFSRVVTNIEPKKIYAGADDRGNINYRFNCSSGYSYISYKSPLPAAAGDSVVALSSKNTLQYISVPLGIRYHINKGKISFTPGAGIAANFLTKTKLETEIAGQAGNQKTNTTSMQGLSPVYFSGSVSFGINYNLSKSLALSFMPVSHFALSSITRDASIKTYLNSLSLTAGLTIKL